jgi:hypothetical protein
MVGRSMMGRRIAAAALAVSTLVVVGWSATAFAYGMGPTPTVSVNASTDPCGAISVTATNFAPDEAVTVTLDGTSTVIGTGTTDSTGSATISVRFPSGTSAGTHSIVVTGASGDTSSSTVTGGGPCLAAAVSPAPSSGGGLAFTGADIAAMAGVGAVALGVGGMLILVSRRRRVADSAPQ